MKKLALLIRTIVPLSALANIILIISTFCILSVSSTLPDSSTIKNIELKIPLRVYSADQQLIAEFGDERRKPVSMRETPPILIKAILASEDDDFFNHRGIDLRGLVRSALANFRSGQRQQGASTITMQVARNFFLSREKTYSRKLKEILLALKLEQNLDKDDILLLYLNKIFLGHRSYGFGAAAQVYYGKDLNELSIAEIAMLAGLPKAPSRFNPITNPERALIRRNYVLSRMHELGLLSDNLHTVASSAPITASKHSLDIEVPAHHIAEMVRAKVVEEFGEKAYWQGLNVYTTIKPEKQAAATIALRQGLEKYDRKHGWRGPVKQFDLAELDNLPETYLKEFPSSGIHIPAIVTQIDKEYAVVVNKKGETVKLSLSTSQWAKKHLSSNSRGPAPESMQDIMTIGDVVYIKPLETTLDKKTNQPKTAWGLSQLPNISGALISVDAKTGKIESLVGGYDFFLNKYNRAVQAIRQPGSNIKPFIYSASLDKGFSPASLISGAPIVIRDKTHGTVWRPENYSGKFFGPTRMREALSKSMNLVSIRLLRSIGIPYTLDYLERFGIDTDRFSPSLTLALGSGGITPLDMLSAYTVLANGGYRVKPIFIDYITDRDGNTIFQSQLPDFCDPCYDELYGIKEEATDLEDTIEGTKLTEYQEEDSAAEQDRVTTTSTIEVEEDPNFYEAPRVMSVNNHFLTTSMLKDVINLGTARKALALDRSDLAGKTGTTNDYVDAWFSGFNSQIATTVWVGFDKPRSMGRGEAGSVAALPIWINYMRTALQGIPQDEEIKPDSIGEYWINKETAQVTDEFDFSAIKEYYMQALPQAEAGEGSLETAFDIEEQFEERKEPLSDEEGLPLDQPSAPPEELVNPNRTRIIEQKSDTEGLF